MYNTCTQFLRASTSFEDHFCEMIQDIQILLDMLPYELGFQYIWVYAWISDIPTVNMTYTISQIHTITVVGKDGIQTFEEVVVVVV